MQSYLYVQTADFGWVEPFILYYELVAAMQCNNLSVITWGFHIKDNLYFWILPIQFFPVKHIEVPNIQDCTNLNVMIS